MMESIVIGGKLISLVMVMASMVLMVNGGKVISLLIVMASTALLEDGPFSCTSVPWWSRQVCQCWGRWWLVASSSVCWW